MKHEEIVKDKLFKISLPDFTSSLFFSFEQSYDFLKKFLIEQGLDPFEAKEYVNEGIKDKHVQGRTTLFINNHIVLIKMNYFDYSIRYISILVHEIIHAAKKILFVYESIYEDQLAEREEAECYLSDYIFEEIMTILKPTIDYNRTYRNMEWLHEVTHKLKEI
jgi:hypothetical protein